LRETILPAIEEGRWVLCDRFTDATLAYQGFGRDLDAAFIRTLNAFSALSLTPDRTLLFDIPVGAGLERARKRIAGMRPEAAEDRFEQEDPAFHGRIRQGYLTLAAAEPDRFRIIDGAAEAGMVHNEVSRCLAELL
jgi:dTMP kinase